MNEDKAKEATPPDNAENYKLLPETQAQLYKDLGLAYTLASSMPHQKATNTGSPNTPEDYNEHKIITPISKTHKELTDWIAP